VKRILLTWLGVRDLELAALPDDAELGPTASVVTKREFHAVVLLSDAREERTRDYCEYLRKLGQHEVHVRNIKLDNPTDYRRIYAASLESLKYVETTFDPDVKLSMHISPGTPQMQTVWVVLAKTQYPAELIQSSVEAGVETVSIPFEISATYLPKSDERVWNLGAGIPVETPEFDQILGDDPQIMRLKALASRAAVRNAAILIQGESGTGKELFAHAIHRVSKRANKHLEIVNCGAIPDELIESELFGYVEGAFTGAVSDKRGKLELANGGTLFLDEIGELSKQAQVKLLRALEDRSFRPVGGVEDKHSDFRVIAATNRVLRDEVNSGRFRADLYHRLSTADLYLPALRDRISGDKAKLIDYFLKRFNEETADQPDYIERSLSAGARTLLIQHQWPGNVRELSNTVFKLVLWADEETISKSEAEVVLSQSLSGVPEAILGRPLGSGLQIQDLLDEVKRHYVLRAETESGGNKSRAADLIGLKNYQTFTNWWNRLVLEKKAGAKS